ncbi:unnamed protein product [Onchocerca flexuosa]|uniref:Anoctamin n=1 Tax=Onchocerca flexuosa TaxID=387005 RepID=A0A183H3F2_9BILA|nr:unnamed protein product [Onchocerca flexuosa]
MERHLRSFEDYMTFAKAMIPFGMVLVFRGMLRLLRGASICKQEEDLIPCSPAHLVYRRTVQ